MRNLSVILFVLFCPGLFGQSAYTTFNAHSHNDYKQKIPFFRAYQAHFGSIEADIWAVNGQLLVAHGKDEIKKERSLDVLYIQPIVSKFRENNGKAWRDREGRLQLLIELKSPYRETLPLLVSQLQKYRNVFDSEVNPDAVMVVITGHTPPPSEFANYPKFISFDGNLYQKYNAKELARVAMFSDDLSRYTSWKGEGNIPEKDAKKLQFLVDSVHALPCKIRFWDAPDTPFAWKQLQNLKVDFINTDHIQQLEKFLTKE
jgi:alkaline phosphatase